MQVPVAYVRSVCLNSQRHEAVLQRPALVCFDLVLVGAFKLLRRARGAGDDCDGALSRVRLAFLSPGAAIPRFSAGITVVEEAALGGTRLVFPAVLRGRGNLTGVGTVFEVSIFALVVAVLVAVTEIYEKHLDCEHWDAD